VQPTTKGLLSCISAGSLRIPNEAIKLPFPFLYPFPSAVHFMGDQLDGLMPLLVALLYFYCCYLRQVNKEVNGGDSLMCLFDVCVLCVRSLSGTVNQTSLKQALNANSSKTVKAKDL